MNCIEIKSDTVICISSFSMNSGGYATLWILQSGVIVACVYICRHIRKMSITGVFCWV